MKHFLICNLLLLGAISSGEAKKKKTKEPFLFLSATYSYNEGIRKVGNVYEFNIKAMRDGVRFDSVWFGNAPVPCDVLDGQKHKVDSTVANKTYTVRANKNVYENFPQQYDSTSASHFKKPFMFNGEAVMMYWYKGKRCYKVVNKVKQINPKGHRD